MVEESLRRNRHRFARDTPAENNGKQLLHRKRSCTVLLQPFTGLLGVWQVVDGEGLTPGFGDRGLFHRASAPTNPTAGLFGWKSFVTCSRHRVLRPSVSNP